MSTLLPGLSLLFALLLKQRRLLVSLFLLLQLSPQPVHGQLVTCVKQISSCKCETNSGKLIDLTPLALAGDFRFKKLIGPNGMWVYSYNPCNGVQCDTFVNAASCQNDIRNTQSYQIGLQDTAKFGYSSADGLHIMYSNGQSSGVIRSSIVSLVCRPNGPDEFVPTDDGGVTNPYIFHSRLTSQYACEIGGGGGGGGGDGGGMSGGDVLLIIFFVLLIVYVAGGFAVNVFILKKAVGVEALPNVSFWVLIPGYVKEGAVFTFGKVRSLASGRRQEYSNI